MPPIQESRERYLLFIPPRVALKSRQRPNRRPVDPAKPWTSDHLWHPARMKPDGAPSSRQHVMSSIQVRLRCVRDERMEHPTESGPTSYLEPYVLYEQSFETLPPGETLRELPLTFDLPADLPGNELGPEQATYWQVALKIPVPGPDIEAVFLAPVYSPAKSPA